MACPEGAVHVSPHVEVVAAHAESAVERGVFDVDPRDGPGPLRRTNRGGRPTVEESAALLRARIQGRLGRSLHVRQVDAGSCNGCELEIAATTNPIYDLERFGIHFVASPRHADVLLVTGPVTRNMESGPAPHLRRHAGAADRRRRRRVRLQRRVVRRRHLRVGGRRGHRPARRRGRTWMPASPPGHPPRAARGHGRARGATAQGRVGSRRRPAGEGRCPWPTHRRVTVCPPTRAQARRNHLTQACPGELPGSRRARRRKAGIPRNGPIVRGHACCVLPLPRTVGDEQWTKVGCESLSREWASSRCA